jgi:branched-chain amino acid transport system substrate-binding protein
MLLEFLSSPQATNHDAGYYGDKLMKMRHIALGAALIGLTLSAPARADINVGMTLSLTGAGASLGVPTQNAVKLFPKEIGGQKINYLIVDDGSDPSASVRNFQKLVDEDKVDVIMGSSVSPATLPLVALASEKKVPHISLAASARIVEPQDATRRWTFKAIANENIVVAATVNHMVAQGVKSLAFIGFADAYGDSWLGEARKQAEAANIKWVATEKYARTDTSVTAQILKIVAAKPDAVLIAGAGTPGALPQKALLERGYKGKVYQTYGIANRDFLKLAGKDAEGAYLAAGGVLVAPQLDSDNPMRAVALDATNSYEAANGKDSMSVFVANAFDANLLLRAGLTAALPKAAPGTDAFRTALRDALEQVRGLVTTQGVISMSTTDHVGYDKRAAVMMQIQNGTWKYVK